MTQLPMSRQAGLKHMHCVQFAENTQASIKDAGERLACTEVMHYDVMLIIKDVEERLACTKEIL